MAIALQNYYEFVEPVERPRRSTQFIQTPARGIIAGASGSGKTLLAVNILLKHLYYDNIIFVTTTRGSALTVMLEAFFEGIQDRIDSHNESVMKKDHYDAGELLRFKFKMIDPTEVKTDILDQFSPGEENIIIFDDCLDQLIHSQQFQEIVERIYFRGRHRTLSVVFITQQLSAVSTRIRQNSTFIIVFGKPTRQIKDTMSSILYDYPVWTRIFSYIGKPADFIFIDLIQSDETKKISINLDQWLDLREIV